MKRLYCTCLIAFSACFASWDMIGWLFSAACIISASAVAIYCVRLRRMRSEYNQRLAIICILGISGCLILYTTRGKVVDKGPPVSTHAYGVMFDAGSTGSRIHVFKFKHTNLISQPFEFEEELFVNIKPGLSAYAENPKKGGESLITLLDKAKAYVPQSQWATTPIALKATAGLRLLPEKQANELLSEVELQLKSYPFLLAENGVEILEGTNEGVFSWFTFNYFAGYLRDLTTSIAVMDLGGGSTQVTFLPTEQSTWKSVPAKHAKEMKIFGRNQKLYSHSYLGYGLMSARFALLGGEEGKKNSNDILESVCVKPEQTRKWWHGQKQYTIVGRSLTKGSRYEACKEIALKFIISATIDQPPELKLKSKPICLISYYYDRAVSSGIISEDPAISVLAYVQNFTDAAIKVCNSRASNLEKPFLCMDVVYIETLLSHGFGLQPDRKLMIKKKVNGHEISWALGAMFPMMDEVAL